MRSAANASEHLILKYWCIKCLYYWRVSN